MSIIDEKTKVPLVLVASTVPFLVGGVIWLTSIDSKASQAIEKASHNEEQLSTTNSRLLDIKERLIRIEEHLKRK